MRSRRGRVDGVLVETVLLQASAARGLNQPVVGYFSEFDEINVRAFL